MKDVQKLGAAARAAWQDGELDVCLAHLLELWRVCPVEKVADAVEHVGDRLARSPETTHWDVASFDAVSLSRALTWLELQESMTVGVEKALAHLERWLPDPRVAHTIAVLRKTRAIPASKVAKLALLNLAKATAELDPTVEADLEHIVAGEAHQRFGAKQVKAVRARAVEMVHANPLDLGVRRVAADSLLNVGDPMGEWLTLQLHRAPGAAASARELELWEDVGQKWLELVLGANSYSDVVLDRGLPRGISCSWFPPMTPAWASVVELEVHRRAHSGAKWSTWALVLPQLKHLALRSSDDLDALTRVGPAPSLETLAIAEGDWESGSRQPGVQLLTDGSLFPALREVSVTVSSPEQVCTILRASKLTRLLATSHEYSLVLERAADGIFECAVTVHPHSRARRPKVKKAAAARLARVVRVLEAAGVRIGST